MTVNVHPGMNEEVVVSSSMLSRQPPSSSLKGGVCRISTTQCRIRSMRMMKIVEME